MNEDQFRKMLDAIIDGIWYDYAEGDPECPLPRDVDYSAVYNQVMRHISTGVRGTPAEAWLKAWREKQPPTYTLPNPFPTPFNGGVPSAVELMRMPMHARKAWLSALYDAIDWDEVVRQYQLVEDGDEGAEEEEDDD